MRTRVAIVVALLVAVLATWGGAQQPQPNTADMMKMHEQMMAQMKAGEAKLDALVADMNAASGSAKVDAVAAVVTELVRQQTSGRCATRLASAGLPVRSCGPAVHQHMGQMHGHMMSRGMMGGRGMGRGQ